MLNYYSKLYENPGAEIHDAVISKEKEMLQTTKLWWKYFQRWKCPQLYENPNAIISDDENSKDGDAETHKPKVL